MGTTDALYSRDEGKEWSPREGKGKRTHVEEQRKTQGKTARDGDEEIADPWGEEERKRGRKEKVGVG